MSYDLFTLPPPAGPSLRDAALGRVAGNSGSWVADAPAPNATVPPAAVPRVSAQSVRIIERLRQGRATNAELAGISLKYTARVSDIRAAGYDVRCVEHDRATGVAWYALFENGKEA